MQVAFFSNCDCDSVTVATRFFTFLPFYPFTLLPLKLSSQSCQKLVESILVGNEHLARFRTLLSTYDAC